MNASECFLIAYRQHRPLIADRLLQDLTETQVRVAPAPGVNTIAWLLWHMARTEDVVVNRFLVDGRQVFDDGGWGQRLGVAVREFGVAMSADEVRALSAAIDLAELRAYGETVRERTEAVVRRLEPTDLDETIAAERVQRAIVEEGICPTTPWIYDWVTGFWSGKLKGFMLQYYGLGHNLLHYGEGMAIRGLMGRPGR